MNLPDVLISEDFWEPRDKYSAPVEAIKHKAKVDIRDSVAWITYPDDHGRGRRKKPGIVEMPENAPTKSCNEAPIINATIAAVPARKAACG